MSTDNPCVRFESALAELLGRDSGPVEREALESLRAHLEACEACAPSRELVEMLAAPAGRRDPVPDPGEGYWRTFDQRVHSRIEADTDAPGTVVSPGPAAGRGAGGRPRLKIAAAAAVLAVVALLTLPGIGKDDPGVVAEDGPAPRREAALETLDGLLPGDPSLLDGLEELRAAAGDDAEGLFDGFDDSLGRELDWELLPAGTEPLLPEPEMLDGASRDELLNWLRGEETEA